MESEVSRPVLILLTISFIGGVAYGIYRNVKNVTWYVADDPKNDAVTVHIVIAVCVVVLVAAVQTFRSRKKLSNVWTAPFMKRSSRRLKATIFSRDFTLLTIPRLTLCLVMTLVIVFAPFRIGEQIIGGLDQAATNNSWGGPSYAGSMAAHDMDMLILLYCAALTLHTVMVKPE